jgi:hypothetical protein
MKTKMTIRNLTNLISPGIARGGFLFIPLLLVCLVLSSAPNAFGVSPAPDGGYLGANTAEGEDALFNLNVDQGFDNTAVGFQALYSDVGGHENTATGRGALFSNIGSINTANGSAALASNTTGGSNTANGGFALDSNTTGGQNTADGSESLHNNTIGTDNIALGFRAGYNLTVGSNNIDIGNAGIAAEANTIRIGGSQTNAFMAGIYNATVVKGIGIVVDASGHLGTKGSSERFKDAIKPMDKASETLLALKPVTFHYKKELDPEGVPQFGLIAEEVAKVNPDLVARDANGKIYTVRYEAVNAMLLNEFLKEHRQVQEQQKQIEKLTARLNEQASQIQKVSAQLELNKPALQTVINNQ